ncbi:MAG: hypothetical protein EBZ62_00075 [Sphingobacteriia bacterium]|nr:hypothetical protein [Sphingobacteriia bacterium]
MQQKSAEKTETIFIQIASYRDPQLLPTLKDAIDKAKYPDNLRFGISWQHHPDDAWDSLDEYIHDNRFKIIDIDYRDSQGVCWARNLVQNLYQKETYTLQLDSHHRFIQGWDEILIDMLKELQKNGSPKPLITAYIPSFDPNNDPNGRILEPWKMTFDRFIPEGAVFFLPAPLNPNIEDINKPIPGRFYSAHFAFTLGVFCKEVPHDPNYYFHGEEISIAARAFTHGYDIYYPHKVICWHEYTRRGRSKQWDDIVSWSDRNSLSHARNRQLFGMDIIDKNINFGRYGFGNIRTLKDYEKYTGLHFKTRSITQEVIDHIPPSINNIRISDEEFNNKLLPIFKHCIDIGYSQVPADDYDFWCVAFKNKNGEDIYRQDATADEIKNMKNDPDGYCKIWRSFLSVEKPHSWIVWPHSISEGWSDPISGIL